MADIHHKTKAELVCLDERAFYAIFHELVDKVKQATTTSGDPWISAVEAMQLLRITSKTTFKKFCDSGEIRVARLTERHLLYYRDSILAFIEKHVNKFEDGGH